MLLALVVVVVRQQFNGARSYVGREANELLDLYRTASVSPRGSAASFSVTRRYLGAVLGEEWVAMTRNPKQQNARPQVRTGARAERLVAGLEAPPPPAAARRHQERAQTAEQQDGGLGNLLRGSKGQPKLVPCVAHEHVRSIGRID